MADRLEIVQGATPYHYHVLPSEISRATVSPQREAIFQYLSRLSSDDFVDYVIDLLVEVNGHTLVERTEGPGDEKQDILTLDQSGERHLTQCKHTINYKDNTSGDELDLLFGACHRKNCRRALYVTNTDLTPQAKRYVTDKEYTRFAASDAGIPEIDYWNGRRIWDQVSKSHAILNKWFSGMAQAHALRRFFFDVVITRMPSGEPCELYAQDLATALEQTYTVAVAENRSFDVTVDASVMFNLSDWFRGSGDLGIAFVPPTGDCWHPNMPLRTLRIQALISDAVDAYDVAKCRDRITDIVVASLSGTGEDEWWHAVSTAPQAFVFLQDVAKARLVDIEAPETFVRVGVEPAMRERTWAFRPGSDFAKVVSPGDPDDVAWTHAETGSTLRILVDEDIHPALAFDLQLRQDRIIGELRTHAFRAVENADAAIIETVRRLVDPRWFVLTSSRGELFWGYPPDADETATKRLEGVLLRRGIEVLAVKDSDRDTLLESVNSSPAEFGGMIVTGEHASSTPIKLEHRTFLFSRDFELAGRPSVEHLVELAKFKMTYEVKHGYNALGEKSEHTITGEEIKRLLFDPMSLRGRRMIDIGISNRSLSIHLRIREGSISIAESLVAGYASEFADACEDIVRRL